MHYHQKTEHTYHSVRNGRYIDWDTQPSAFKTYPHFLPRTKLEFDNPTHRLILLSGAISAEKSYAQNKYYMRINPSAGALYPNEIYVQIRKIDGFLDGIYHFEVAGSSLVLVQEISKAGLEGSLGLDYCVDGFLFLISSPYFRSSWKYHNRAFRYSLLDCGHILGALEASSYLLERDVEFIFDFDKLKASEIMGFENKEMALALAIIGEKSHREVRALRESLHFVLATDYFIQNSVIEEAYKETLNEPHQKCELQKPTFDFEKNRFLDALLQRRSTRAFEGVAISKNKCDFVLENAKKPISSIEFEKIDIFYTANNIDGVEKGLYLDGKALKTGDFRGKAGYLCLEQALGSASGVTLFLSSHFTNYQTATIFAGIIGHRIYLASGYQGIGCSGIGAYFDKEVQEFIGSDGAILYALAFGR